VTFTLPPINSAQDAAATVSAVLAAVAAGELTPADAGEISKLIEAYVKAFETAELAEPSKAGSSISARKTATSTQQPCVKPEWTR
jgi:hypothetical protein